MIIKVWVSDLHAYNSGHLVGDWFELPVNDVEEDIIKPVLNKGEQVTGERGEEWAIHDYEFESESSEEAKLLNTFPSVFRISEYSSLSRVNEAADELYDMEYHDLAKLAYYAYENGEDIIEALGENPSLDDIDFYPDYSIRDLAYEFVEDGLISDEQLEYYFDEDAYVRDLQLNGDLEWITEDEEELEKLYEMSASSLKDYLENNGYLEGAFESLLGTTSLQYYIDYDAIARDLEMDYTEIPGIGVFRMI